MILKLINWVKSLFSKKITFEQLVESIRCEISFFLEDLIKKYGEYKYYGYLKTSPNAVANNENTMGHFLDPKGFEELDCRVDLGIKRIIRRPGDREEIACNEITLQIAKFIKPLLKIQPYTRVIVEKNGEIKIDITR